nr:hypothetical protein [Halomonas malpeensis]
MLIIGRGIAELTLALGIADHLAVTLVGAADRDRGASRWAHVGIVRFDADLGEAAARLDELEAERLALGNTEHPKSRRLTQRVRLARLTVDAARARRESRGLHYSTDWPAGKGAHSVKAQTIPVL